MKKLLITGFDPFGGESINPAWEAVRLLPDVIRDFELVKLEIPTVFGAAAQVVIALTAYGINPGTDARFIKNYCPVIEFGLVCQTIHQIDERVVVTDLDRLTKIYGRILQAYFADADA